MALNIAAFFNLATFPVEQPGSSRGLDFSIDVSLRNKSVRVQQPMHHAGLVLGALHS